MKLVFLESAYRGASSFAMYLVKKKILTLFNAQKFFQRLRPPEFKVTDYWCLTIEPFSQTPPRPSVEKPTSQDLRSAHRNGRSRGRSLLPGHGTFSPSKVGGCTQDTQETIHNDKKLSQPLPKQKDAFVNTKEGVATTTRPDSVTDQRMVCSSLVAAGNLYSLCPVQVRMCIV